MLHVGCCPTQGYDVYLDAEDPAHANWTRFINHCARTPNLALHCEFTSARSAAARDSTEGYDTSVAAIVAFMAMLGVRPASGAVHPRARFVVERPIKPGDELLFNYGTGFVP